MYPRNAVAPERISLGQVVLISDGTVQSTGVAVTVRGQGGAEAASGGTIAYGADNTVYYTPTQAETNFTSFVAIASKASCFSASVTIVTTASVTPGKVVLSGETHTSAVIPTVTTVGTLTTYTGNTPQTGDSFARIGVAGAGLSNIDLPDQTMNITGNLSGTVGSVTGNVGGIAGTITTLDGLDTAQDTQHGTTQSNIAALNNVSTAQVNAEVVDALNTDTYAEPAQGTPGATVTLAAKINYLYKAWRNRSTQTATTYSLYNDDATTVGHKATVSDDATTADKGEVVTGP